MTQAEGNTNFRARSWILTINNYTDTDISQLESLIEESYLHCYGKEVAPETGTPHIQGYISFENARYFSGMKKRLPRAHLKKARGTPWENLEYCSKENLISTNIKPKAPLKLITNLYDWQRDIEAIANAEPDDRKVYWFWEGTGNVGKSSLCKYLVARYPHIICIGTGRSADIITCVEEQYTCYLLDFPRSMDPAFAPYNAIEQIKNGMITDGKLKKKARILVFNSPQVICFANWPPEYEVMSADRWVIRIL